MREESSDHEDPVSPITDVNLNIFSVSPPSCLVDENLDEVIELKSA